MPLTKASRYTRIIEGKNGCGVLYNGYTGAALKLDNDDIHQVKNFLQSINKIGGNSRSDNQTQLLEKLKQGGFIIDSDIDELELLKDDYKKARSSSKFILTIFPTFSCNLTCDYCFMGKDKGRMSDEILYAVVDFAQRKLDKTNPPYFFVDWMGGEPLLAIDTVHRLSCSFKELCNKRNIPYESQMITNGTLINRETSALLEACNITSLQITLDGDKKTHDSRRKYKMADKSSYDHIIDGLEHVIGKFLIRLRINVDAENVDNIWSLLNVFAEKGWLTDESRFYPYLGLITPYTASCSWVTEKSISQKAFINNTMAWMYKLHEYGVPVIARGLYLFPDRKECNCMAVADNGYIITPTGEVHKCGLTPDDSSQAIGNILNFDQLNRANVDKWCSFSPFDRAECLSCDYLPSCLGGCPRDQLLKRSIQTEANCTFHKQFEDLIIAEHLNLS